MRIRQISNPNTKAEGRCNGLPYNTELVSINGVSIHFWVGSVATHPTIDIALRKAMNHRDIVAATWSFGKPDGFWHHSDIE